MGTSGSVRVPNPADVLPAAGVQEVLIQAAASHPIIALLLVAIIICFAWWCTCYVFIKRKQYDVMKSPEAAKAMVELKRMEKEHKKTMARLKNGGKNGKRP